MDYRSDFLNTPSHRVPQCVQNSGLPPDATPAEAGAGIFSYYKEVKGWPNQKIRALAEYVINLCDGGIVQSTHEVVVSFFADLLETDPTTLFKSGQNHKSFSKTMGSEKNFGRLAGKLNLDQALYIAKTIVGEPEASNLECDKLRQRGSVRDFSFYVIKRICQMKDQSYSIQNFLDELKNPDVST